MASAANVDIHRESSESSNSTLFDQHFSPAELAEAWKLSDESVRRIFEREPGVLIFENPEKASERRRRTMRIPASVAERVYRRLCNRSPT